VAPNQGDNNVSILLGVGDGTFFPAGDYNVGVDPDAVAAGDFNEDGHVDVVVANYTSDSVSRLRGVGNGAIAGRADYAVGDGPVFVIVADFNEDGHEDLATANYISHDVSVLLGVGNGTFAPAVSYRAHLTPSAIVAGDFNDDEQLDLVVTKHRANKVSVLSGAGDGTFAVALEGYAVGNRPRGVVAGDFDEDGHPDLAVANEWSNDVTILINLADGDVPTLLRSYSSSFSGNAIEVTWELGSAGSGLSFQVYREKGESEAFLPLETAISATGELSYRFVDGDIELGLAYRYRVDAVDEDSVWPLFTTETIATQAPGMVLGQNFPNPFGPSTSIRYGIPARSHVTIEIFDVAGRRIATLVNAIKRPGIYTEEWVGRDASGERVPSGIYFYKLTAGTRSITKKMILVR
jgi:hypothetical protein